MSTMKFDLHVHTDLSPDSPASVSQMVKTAKAAGLDGIAIANHDAFIFPESLDDFLIIPACEYTTDAGHLLTYFINSPLDSGLEKDSRGRYPWREIASRAHAQGGLVFLAHPYAPEVEREEAVFDGIDGIEIYNARIEHSRSVNANLRAQIKAQEKNLPFSCGSDAHFSAEVGAAYWECDCALTLDSVYDALKNKKGRVYGGTASPLYRISSQWLKLYRLRAWRVIPKLIPRTLRALIISLKPKKKTSLVNLPERNENI